MAEYIDKDIAIQICMNSWGTDDASQDIKDEPPADVIERDKVKSLIEVAIEDGWELDYALERLKEI